MTCRRPCAECPWRVDVKAGQFPPERYERLRDTTGGSVGREASLFAPLFACHMGTPGGEFYCAGWVAAVGRDTHLGVRLAAARGEIPADGLKRADDWPELYPSWEALLAVHGAAR